MTGERRFYRLGLIGYPLGHSRSPQLHHAALAWAGLEGEYRLFAIAPTEAGRAEIESLIDDLRACRLDGLNVTIPHKGTVIPFVDRLTGVAEAVSAVNTLSRDASGCIIGDNTDVPGFLHDLARLVGREPAGTALVLGAGGSARAVVYALTREGWSVRVLARRAEQAAALVEDFGKLDLPGPMACGDLQDLRDFAAQPCRLVVNTTPLGMHPNYHGCPWPDDIPLPQFAAVYDLIYNPAETVLLRRARSAGLAASNGAGMLAAQAALAFHQWIGVEPPFETMEKALL